MTWDKTATGYRRSDGFTLEKRGARWWLIEPTGAKSIKLSGRATFATADIVAKYTDWSRVP